MTSTSPEQPHLDPDEWGRLIERLQVPVILVVIGSWMGESLRRDCTAEDLWQDALTMAWRDRESHSWRGLQAFRSWLLGIARHRILDRVDTIHALKRGGGRLQSSLSALAGEGTPSRDGGSVSDLLPPRTTTPSRMASESEQAQILEDVLAALPAELRDIVRLRLFEERSMPDVAAELGIPLSTAYDRFLRGAAIYQRELERRLGSSPGRP